MWWLALEAVIAQQRAASGSASTAATAGSTAHVHGRSTSVYEHIYGGCAASTTEDELRRAVRELAARYRVDIAAFCDELCMTWQEIGELAADPLVTIGAHTVNHVDADQGRRRGGALRDARTAAP